MGDSANLLLLNARESRAHARVGRRGRDDDHVAHGPVDLVEPEQHRVLLLLNGT